MGRNSVHESDELGWLASLIERQPKGHSLLQSFYTDPRVFQWDLEVVFHSSWLLAGHVSRVREPGAYFLYEIAGEQVIVARDDGGDLHAMVNVCRHRGSRVCLEEQGNATAFVCPYHAWTYGPDGALKSARNMPGDFDRASHGLHRVQVRELEGLIFLYLGEGDGPDFAPAVKGIEQYLGPHGLASAQIADREVGVVHGNWKLVIENFLECYHCAPAHPEFTRRHPASAFHFLRDARGQRVDELVAQWSERTAALGHVVGLVAHFDEDPMEPIQAFGCSRGPLGPEFTSMTRDGKAVAPLMGSLREFDGGETGVQVGHSSFVLAYNDYALLVRFVPKTPLETVYEFTWLVAGDALAGRDFDSGEVTWLWRTTNDQDKAIVNANQQGVLSTWYRPGPYSEGEPYTQAFVEGYLARLSKRVEEETALRSD